MTQHIPGVLANYYQRLHRELTWVVLSHIPKHYDNVLDYLLKRLWIDIYELIYSNFNRHVLGAFVNYYRPQSEDSALYHQYMYGCDTLTLSFNDLGGDRDFLLKNNTTNVVTTYHLNDGVYFPQSVNLANKHSIPKRTQSSGRY